VSSLEFVQFQARDDNFGVLIHDPNSGRTAAVDAPETAAVEAALATRNWQLNTLLITHHHHDHVAGLADLKQRHGCEVIGPRAEADKIIGLDRTVAEGDALELFGEAVTVLDTPGHTLGHIVYYLPTAGVLFAGKRGTISQSNSPRCPQRWPKNSRPTPSCAPTHQHCARH